MKTESPHLFDFIKSLTEKEKNKRAKKIDLRRHLGIVETKLIDL